MKMLVVGATGGTGRAVTTELLGRGHQVTAFARRPHRLGPAGDGARLVDGDATPPEAVAGAVAGQGAVIVTLGISEPPVRVRVRRPRDTTPDVRSVGTSVVIDAMQRYDVTRLIVQSSYGVGESRERLKFADRMLFRLLLHPQIEDTERQESAVRASDLNWTLVQPVHLTDRPGTGRTHLSTSSAVHDMRVTREQVAAVLADAAEATRPARQTIAVSTTSVDAAAKAATSAP